METLFKPTETFKEDDPKARKKRMMTMAAALTIVIVLTVVLINYGAEIRPAPFTGFVAFEYGDVDGGTRTRTILDGRRNILRVERVHVMALPNGGTGDVDGILTQTIYGAPRWWGGTPRPMITYDAIKQTVTEHSSKGDRLYTSEKYKGKGAEFEISVYNDEVLWGWK